MGHHWVPQKYLQGFGADGGTQSIWQFDKRSNQFSTTSLPISRVAQQRAYNDPNVEQQLANQIEAPVNPILDELRAGHPLIQSHRAPLAVYMATMLHRVPNKRKIAESLYPKALSNIVNNLTEHLQFVGNALGIDSSIIQRRIGEAETARTQLEGKPPQPAIDQINSPWPTQELVWLIYSMQWCVIEAAGSSTFITSDNPFFYFQCYGFAQRDSEFTFPISPYLAIFGSWRRQKFSRAYSNEYIKEANLRLASAATQFIYCHTNHDWVADIAHTTPEELSRIV